MSAPDSEEEVFRTDHLRWLVKSRSRPNECHLVEFGMRDGKKTQACSCEWFTMGIPRMITAGELPDTPEHRRCRHIRRVLWTIANQALDHLIDTDPSKNAPP